MNEQDTVEWYLGMIAKVKAAREYASKPKPATFNCCGQEQSKGHSEFCVYFSPVGDTNTNRIVRHLPGYIDFDPECVGFNTLEELLNIDWVKWWSKQSNFHRYSYDSYLMAEFDEGYTWYAIGMLRNSVNLPKWEAKYKKLDVEALFEIKKD